MFCGFLTGRNNHGAASLSGLETEELGAAPTGRFYYFGEDTSCDTQCAARNKSCNGAQQLTAGALSRSELDAITGSAGVDSTGYSVSTGNSHPAGPSVHGDRTVWIGLGNDSTCDADGGDWRRVCWCV